MRMMAPIGEVYRGLRASGWLRAAMFVEFLGLAGAISAITSWELLPQPLMIAVAGILSTFGVLIITAHYVLEHNRRPLNDVQMAEVAELLSGYLPAEQARDFAPKAELSGLVPKSEMSNFVGKAELFWLWQYQRSVMELAWTTYGELPREPGYVLVAELTGAGSSSGKIEFSLLAPPVKVGKCQSDDGEEPPRLFQEWGSIFDPSNNLNPGAVFYCSANGGIKYLRMEQKIVFDDRLAAPIKVLGSARTGMPELVRQHKSGDESRRWDEYPYEWLWLTPAATESP